MYKIDRRGGWGGSTNRLLGQTLVLCTVWGIEGCDEPIISTFFQMKIEVDKLSSQPTEFWRLVGIGHGPTKKSVLKNDF